LHAIKKDGTKFPVEISLSPLHTEEGILVSASVRDITGRKELENELRKSTAEMEAFTYSVSHDLRAPLRGIIGFTNILEEDYASKLDDEARRITSVIKNNTLKMGHLIDDLLAFSRMGKREIVKTDVNTNNLVEELINEMSLQNNDKTIKWNIGYLYNVKADITTIRQVLINLISNAIKYSAKKDEQLIGIGSFKRDSEIVFYVKDNGVGFDEAYKHKLFKVFQRLHGAEEFEGTGIGLALVDKIVSKHGGKVWAEGKQDEGACFYFSLPDKD
jgi:light-regulated signal transduction histidine kinase (bacteriophytochrome)